jgi:hypothetical protein
MSPVHRFALSPHVAHLLMIGQKALLQNIKRDTTKVIL